MTKRIRILLTLFLLVVGTAMSWAEFTDFYIDFQSDPYEVILPEDGKLPSNVTVDRNIYNGPQHGAQNPTITVEVTGPVKFTIGSCQYGDHKVTVKDENGNTLAIIDNNKGCDDVGVHSKSVEWSYNENKAATLTFSVNGYLPFFKAEQSGLITDVKVSYYDTDGKTLLGEENVPYGSELSFMYGESDVTVPLGCKFRGWFKSTDEYAEKVGGTFTVNGDMQLYARATLIEIPTATSSYSYDLTKQYWYPEDHEVIEFSGSGSWHDVQHGWAFKNGDIIKLKVAGDATIIVGRCGFSNKSSTITLLKGSKEIGTAPAVVPVEADGAPVSFEYRGGETTLTLKISSGGAVYIHGISVEHNSSKEFEPFKIDFRTNPYTFVTPTGYIPAIVKVTDGEWHDEGIGNDYNTLGYRRAALRVYVDRPVKFTIGTSNDTDHAAVSVNGSATTVIKTNFRDEGGVCDGGPGTYDHNVKYVYKGTEPAVLVFDLGEFCPYFFAEELDIPEYDEATKTFNVAADNVEQLKNAIIEANTMGGNVTIYLPNGTYDLGSDINTEIKADNIAIVGESRDGVIIKNSPTGKALDNTATLKNTSTGLYLQNLTLLCEANYDEKSGKEVGVALWDRGTKTICKNVYLKGKQNTYYSNGVKGMIAYFEGGIIEGSSDFICGSGNVLFNSVQLNVVMNGSYDGVIAAPSSYGGDDAEIGYVFANCLVTGAVSQNDTYYLAHGWKAHNDASSAATFIGTIFAINPINTLWGSTIGGDMKRRFAAYDASGVVLGKDPDNKVDVTKAILIAFAGSWDPAAIISQHSPIKTNGAGWASYTAFTDVYVQGEGVKTYVANKINKHSVLLETVDSRKLPAGTPVFVKGEPNTKYYVCGALVNKITKNNLLVPVLFDTTLNEYSKAFILGTKGGQPGLYKVDSNIVVPAGKCYLDARGTSLELLTKGELEMITDGSEATGIDNVVVGVDADAARYNLAGQKVDKSYKGIVVRKDGKKYFEK